MFAMDEHFWVSVVKSSIYFLAVINPASKIFFLASYTPSLTFRELYTMSWKSTLWAFMILAAFTIVGQFVLSQVFRVEMYSLRVVGGFVVLAIGWTATRKGVFFQKEDSKVHESLSEVSVVPLAAPLIAGPGTIAVAISFATQYHVVASLLVIVIGLGINFGIMLCSHTISRFTHMLSLTGPLIRITGLIVAVVAMQMILDGLRQWLEAFL